MLKLASKVVEWDEDFRGANPTASERHPYQNVLRQIQQVGALRFQPYQNEQQQIFHERLRAWVEQFPSRFQPYAFVLASKILFIGQRQFETLQRHLFERRLRRRLIDTIILDEGLKPEDFRKAYAYLEREIEKTLFIPNSDSSGLNSFCHVNSRYLYDRERRHLVGPEVTFWTYPASRMGPGAPPSVRRIAADYEREVLNSDPRAAKKRRLVVLEDFCGTGSDLSKTISKLERTNLPFREVLLAPVIAAESGLRRVRDHATSASSVDRKFEVTWALEIPDRWRCFGSPDGSYLEDSFVERLPEIVEEMSTWAYDEAFVNSLAVQHKHGVGRLALAFVLYSNCPDNSLPILWKQTENWKTLFRRASRYI